MKFDRYNTNFIIPDGAEINNVMMGYCSSEDKNSPKYIGTFGLGPCTAIAASVIDEDGNVYRFCSHMDMGNIVGISITDHLMRFATFLSKIPNIKSIDCKLVSGMSFLDNCPRTNNEEVVLKGLDKIKEKYKFDVKVIHSTVVQINPKGRIIFPGEYEIEKQKSYKMKEVALANGFFIDYSTKSECIAHEKLGCYLYDVSAIVEEQMKDKTPEEKNEMAMQAMRSGEFGNVIMENNGEIVVGPSPLDPDKQAYFLVNFREIAPKNYGFVPYATTVEVKGLRGPAYAMVMPDFYNTPTLDVSVSGAALLKKTKELSKRKKGPKR